MIKSILTGLALMLGINACLADSKMATIATIKVTVGNQSALVNLESNAATKALIERLQQHALIVTMDDYGDMEKIGELPYSLPQANKSITTRPGDVILYQGNVITIYYDQNSWSLTRLGRLDNLTSREEVLQFLGGKGEVEVKFEFE